MPDPEVAPAPQAAAPPVILYRNLQTKPFIPSDDPMTSGKEWEIWVEGIEREFRFFGIKSEQDKIDALIIFGGPEIARLEKSLPDPADTEITDRYIKLRTKLNDYFVPKKNKYHSRYKFLSTKPQHNEPILSYATRLREIARTCEFENTDERLLEHLIQTVANKALVQKAVNKKWDLTQFLQEAAQMEDIQQQMSDMTQSVAKVRSMPPKKHYSKSRDEKKQERHSKYATCDYCGFNTHPPGKNCPAYGKECRNCKKKNHFSKMCHSDKSAKRTDRYPVRQGRHRHVKATREISDSSTSDEELEKIVKQLQIHKINDIKENPRYIAVQVAGVTLRTEADSGC